MKKLMNTALSLSVAVLAAAPGFAADEKIEAITKPSEDATLAFVRPGRVAKVLVKEGDDVKVDQELVRLDDAAEVLQLAQLKAQADDLTRIKAAEAQLAQKRVDLKEILWAHERGAATEMEVEHSRLEVRISELSLELAKFTRAQDQRKYQEAKIQIDRMRLTSPIAGKVENVLVEPGESADALEKIVRVVKIDPLWIDVPVPVLKARGLKRKQSKANVEFENPGPPRRQNVTGKVIHIAAVADAGSGTLTVRVEVPNPTGRPAGEHVYVSFPDTATARAGASAEPKVAARPHPKK